MNEITDVSETGSAQGLTEEQAAEKLFSKFAPEKDEKPEPEVNTDETEDDGQRSEEDSEPESDESDEAEENESEYDLLGSKIKVKGVEARKLVEEIQGKAKEFEAKHTRKFQEIAEIRKSAESAANASQNLVKLAAEHGELLGHKQVIAQRMNQLRSIDVRALQMNDPAALAGLTAEMQQLQFTDQQISQKLMQAVHGIRQSSDEMRSAKEAEAHKYAQSIKNWSDEYNNRLLHFIENDIGAPPSEVKAQMSGWLMKLIHKAYEGSKVTQAKPWEKKTPQQTQTIKPGTSGQQRGSNAVAAEKAVAKVRKSGSVEDAAEALLARSRLKRK